MAAQEEKRGLPAEPAPCSCNAAAMHSTHTHTQHLPQLLTRPQRPARCPLPPPTPDNTPHLADVHQVQQLPEQAVLPVQTPQRHRPTEACHTTRCCPAGQASIHLGLCRQHRAPQGRGAGRQAGRETGQAGKACDTPRHGSSCSRVAGRLSGGDQATATSICAAPFHQPSRPPLHTLTHHHRPAHQPHPTLPHPRPCCDPLCHSRASTSSLCASYSRVISPRHSRCAR